MSSKSHFIRFPRIANKVNGFDFVFSFFFVFFQPIDFESFEARLALTGTLVMVIVVGIWAAVAFYCFLKHEKKRLQLEKLNKTTQL